MQLTMNDWKNGEVYCFGCYEYGTKSRADEYIKNNGGTCRKVVAWEIREHLRAVGYPVPPAFLSCAAR